jgi:hypothetical protein
MRDHMRQTEKDTIDVVTFLKKQDVDKDTEVNDYKKNIIIRLHNRLIVYNNMSKLLKWNIEKIKMNQYVCVCV